MLSYATTRRVSILAFAYSFKNPSTENQVYVVRQPRDIEPSIVGRLDLESVREVEETLELTEAFSKQDWVVDRPGRFGLHD